MKLKNLHEAFDQIRINNGDELPDTSEDTDDVSGSGVFARVKGDKDPHMINKIAKKWDTAYNAYVDFLIDNKVAQANPHFPRIYVAQNGTKWQMEKLQYTLYDYLNTTNDSISRSDLSDRLETLVDIYFKDHVGIDDYYDFAMNINHPENIKLGTYRKALSIVKELHKELGDKYPQSVMSLDLHAKNIMVRMSQVGPQLVITDPFADMNEVHDD